MATKPDLAKLNKRVSALSNALAKLGKGTDLVDLLLIIKKPGWTTPAELAFTNALLGSAEVQLGALAETLSGLKGAAKLVAPQVVGDAKPARKGAAKKAKK
jgi:hypothetical protein